MTIHSSRCFRERVARYGEMTEKLRDGELDAGNAVKAIKLWKGCCENARSLACKLSNRGRRRMIRLIAIAGFALVIATSAQAITPAPIPQLDDGMITPVAYGCGPFRTLVNGVCMARTTIRQARRQARRCVRWTGTACVVWHYY